MWSRKQLKDNAKKILSKNYWKAFLVTLVLITVTGAGSGAFSGASSSMSSFSNYKFNRSSSNDAKITLNSDRKDNDQDKDQDKENGKGADVNVDLGKDGEAQLLHQPLIDLLLLLAQLRRIGGGTLDDHLDQGPIPPHRDQDTDDDDDNDDQDNPTAAGMLFFHDFRPPVSAGTCRHGSRFDTHFSLRHAAARPHMYNTAHKSYTVL